MTKRTFEDSRQEGGLHHRLAQLAGEWEGTTKTWFEPDKLADESPWRGTIRPVVGGRFVMHEYEGSMQGKPLSGVAIYGYHVDSDRFEMAWVDSFHTGTSILFSKAANESRGYNVLTSYEAPSGPPWGWRTEIQQPEPDRLIITHYNIIPDNTIPGGLEAKAVETVYRRKR
ncbi:DUF1579 domain-containing protein [Archangium lansingense]|uniref:DUF1579 domain-containing protein n=1 Tax=Archangium lansingense TaxID=2995310 RepID=A0ABT3ZW65_9BACT|nr:DUF1579 domain-containing protein [Archangium lansinium]MCY1073541.1 DUF1579 domain-containing protein [Archangium lansinium]